MIRLGLIALALLSGCTASAADMKRINLDDEALQDSSLDSEGRWQSAPSADSLWLSLSGRRTLVVEHDLGREPSVAHVYLSFDKDDRDTERTRSFFIGAGDTAHLSSFTDETVTVENTTNADFYLRLVLE